MHVFLIPRFESVFVDTVVWVTFPLHSQEIMVLVINADTASSIWAFSAQSELKGCKCPLKRAEEVAGNEETPTLSSAAKRDTNQMPSHQMEKLEGLLC